MYTYIEGKEQITLQHLYAHVAVNKGDDTNLI